MSGNPLESRLLNYTRNSMMAELIALGIVRTSRIGKSAGKIPKSKAMIWYSLRDRKDIGKQ